MQYESTESHNDHVLYNKYSTLLFGCLCGFVCVSARLQHHCICTRYVGPAHVTSANTIVLSKQLFALNTNRLIAVFRFFTVPVKSLLLKGIEGKAPVRLKDNLLN